MLAGGDHRNGNDGLLATQAHDGAFAKLLFDLSQRKINCAGPVFGHEALLARRLQAREAAMNFRGGKRSAPEPPELRNLGSNLGCVKGYVECCVKSAAYAWLR